ncbi:MAG: DUF262 domain-containing protein [Methylotetracoccus sp.]
MSIKYDSSRAAVSEIIKNATMNATYVVPDLQRPYVWTPAQVTLLIDSLFRGWPFGSLLVWEVKPDCFSESEGIPHRPFWQVVDRTMEDTGSSASTLGRPATYQMVLDGQQRIQSLILALGGDQWGFKLYDADWALDLQGRRVRPTTHWSYACLCLDLQSFSVELKAKSGKARKLEVGKILDWVVLDPVHGRSSGPRPANYVFPLLNGWENEGRFIRLSRIWNLAQKDLSEDEYRDLLEPMLREHQLDEEATKELLPPLAQFMKVVENVKHNSFVHALKIESFQLTPQWSKDDYSDAIVNIFTRLNTAGRTLSREEITLAWLKVGWSPSDTGGMPAGQCLEQLQGALADRGFRLNTDEVVRLISFVWAVEHRAGNLLDAKDLLKGDIVRSLAASTAKNWGGLTAAVEKGAEIIKERDLAETAGSFNAIIVFLAWYRIVVRAFDSIGALSVVDRDNLEKHLKARAEHFVDRWIFGSEWAGVWGDAAVANFQNFASDLNSLSNNLGGCSASTILSLVDGGISRLMDRVSAKATQHVDNLMVADRRRVHAYFPLLWVWHRLETHRWKCSSLPMRTGRKRTSKLEVDHTIADAWWKRLIEAKIEERLATFEGDELEKAMLGPDGFENRYQAIAFVNALGNCSLLDKSFNISKSDEPMWSFLKEVHEFKEGKLDRADWQDALGLSDLMTEPTGAAMDELKAAIQARDQSIRIELKEFLSGIRHRVDVGM